VTATARNLPTDPFVNEIVAHRENDNHVARFRPNELRRLCDDRYGRVITPDDAGNVLVSVMLDSLALSPDPQQLMANFLEIRCPWMPRQERSDAIERALRERRFWTPSGLGDALKLTLQERQSLKIRTIRPAGFGDDEMVAMRQAAESARKQAKRGLERLHPQPRRSKPDLRLEAILKIITKPGDWICIKALCAEIKRRKVIHFATLVGPDLTSAVHDAVRLGLQKKQIDKRLVDGPKFKIAEISRRKSA
jgi:hypothetical protein